MTGTVVATAADATVSEVVGDMCAVDVSWMGMFKGFRVTMMPWRSLAACLVVIGVAGSGYAQVKPTERTDQCSTSECHVGITNREFMHEPAKMEQCLECHEYASPETHEFRLPLTGSDLCAKCHTLDLQRTVHAPVAEGKCLDCHDAHGTAFPQLLVEDASGALCLTCHDGYSDKEYVHGPVAVGVCIVCHKPHSSGQDHLLTMSPKRLCVQCHTGQQPTGIMVTRQHRAMEAGCTTCHNPHASDTRFQLEQPVPKLCFSCHNVMEESIGNSKIVHGPAAEEDGCVKCDTPHFSSLPKLQNAPQPDICLRCHNKPIEMEKGAPLTDMATLLAENPDHHGPIREGACTACHQPHAENNFRLLMAAYPREFYAPYNQELYRLCFSCHMSDLAEDESGMGLTGFRNGDKNLHWMHVNKEKGRTCRACHEVHASKRPFHIREAVPFGESGWMLRINFEKTKDGGRCSPACHKPREYSRTVIQPANKEEP